MLQSSYILINGLRYHYYYDNLGKTPILLLHGLASTGRIWEKAAQHLAEHGFSLYALDIRGHGNSDQAETGYDFETISQDIAGFVQACDLNRPVVIGHSWGAMLALDYAARLSIGPRSPSALVLADGAFIQMDAIPGATWESTRARLTPPRLAGTPLNEFLERISAFNTAWQLDEQDKDIILANFMIDADEKIAPRLTFDHHMQIVEAMWKFPTYLRYKNVRCPVLALPARPQSTGSEREIEFLQLKENGLQQIKAACPHLQVRWMEDSVHDFPLQRPERFADWVAEFLQNSL